MERQIQADNAFLEWMVKMSKNVVHIADAWYAAVKWADQHPHWISVKDELPKHDVEENGLITYPSVLVCLYDGYRDESYYDDIRGEWGDYDGEVEYWMPMPPPPTKEGGQEDAS